MPNGDQPAALGLAIKAWNMMNGVIDWQSLALIADWVGANDIESLIDHLQLIQQFSAQQDE